MRIISGEFKRRKLLANPGDTTRPITDRAKETLFNHISESIKEKHVADIFAGTGSMGIEALSRGAKTCVFFEKDKAAADLLRLNLETLSVKDRTLAWQTDILRTSFKPKQVPHLVPFNYIFFDPPYEMAKIITPGGKLYAALERLGKPDVTLPGSRLIFRTTPEHVFKFPPAWQEERRFELGTMLFIFYSSVQQLDSVETEVILPTEDQEVTEL